MEKSALIHKSDSIYSFPLSNNEIEIRLLTKKNDDIKKIELVYNDKYKFHEGIKLKQIFKKFSDDQYDYYIDRLKLEDYRFAYIFRITTLDGDVFYFSESGVTEDYDITKGFYDFFQVSYINPIDIIKKNKIISNRVFYQIFVDRFNKSPDNNNPLININWGDKVTNKTIAGGNLRGIKEKVSYLKDLGIDALYLTPIFKSDSNHKYDIKDYYSISDDFGNDIDLKSLINELHNNDMLLVLDGVFNHISIDNELFKDVIKNGKKSKYYDWFFIKGEKVNLEKTNYERFADEIKMPKLNLNNKEVQKYVIGIGKYYISNFNIDGFRLDVSDEIPHRFWIMFKEEMLKENPNFILIGENWHNAHSYLNSGYEFDSIMNYSITKEVLYFIAWEKYSASHFKDRIISNLMRYQTNVNYNMLNLLSSHDVHRFLTECNENVDKFLMGYSFIFTHIGVPCIYYGDEIGLKGGYDPDSRRCFLWDENKWNIKIRETIKKLIQIRKQFLINNMDYNIDVKDDVVIVTRKDDENILKLYINNNETEKIIDEDNQILLSNRYINKKLNSKGFLITRKDIKK